jgi:methionyl-tRNA formyltransferase
LTEPTPLKEAALAADISVWQPETLKDAEPREFIARYKPDIVIVAAYGKILPAWVWEDPPMGAINIHGSLLPAYRGAAPIQRAVINGETETGVTIIKVAPKVDTGDMLISRVVPIGPEETSGELFVRLAVAGAEMVVQAVGLIESGAAEWQPQSEEGTYAEKIEKSEARIDWTRDAVDLKNLVRGMNPNPGAFFKKNGKRIKAWKSAAMPSTSAQEPGSILEILPAGPVVHCGRGSLLLTKVQPEGKQAMSGAEYARGYRMKPGEKVE